MASEIIRDTASKLKQTATPIHCQYSRTSLVDLTPINSRHAPRCSILRLRSETLRVEI